MERVVLITGASGGLGNAVTRAFISLGDAVVGTSRTIKQSEHPQRNFTAIPADITNVAEAERLIAAVREQKGRIDSLIHVMGGFSAGAVHETDDGTWARMRDLNLTSAFNIFRAVLPIMREQRSGRIIAVGSLAAAEAGKGIAAYSTFKTALVSLVKIVAAENNEFGITANIVLPGTMNTPGNRASGLQTRGWIPPETVADVIVFLASDAAKHVTGAAIPIQGVSL